MEQKFKTLSEALYSDSHYLTKLANKPSMREYCQDIINATVDMNRAAFALEQIKEEIKTKYIGECSYDEGINAALSVIKKYTNWR